MRTFRWSLPREVEIEKSAKPQRVCSDMFVLSVCQVGKPLRVSISINFAAETLRESKSDVHAFKQTPDAAYFCEELAACMFLSSLLPDHLTGGRARSKLAKSRPVLKSLIAKEPSC